MSSARTRCPTCGSPVVIASGDEGTSHYVPANARQVTEAFAEVDRLRTLCARAAQHLRTLPVQSDYKDGLMARELEEASDVASR